MSAGLDVDAGAKVAELRETIATIEALIAEKRRELLAARGALTLWNRVHVAVQAANNGAKRIGTGSGIDNVAIGNENRRLVLDLMGDGATRKVGEIAEAIDRLPGTIGGVVARLVKAGELERPTFSTYRLARKSASPPPVATGTSARGTSAREGRRRNPDPGRLGQRHRPRTPARRSPAGALPEVPGQQVARVLVARHRAPERPLRVPVPRLPGNLPHQH